MEPHPVRKKHWVWFSFGVLTLCFFVNGNKIYTNSADPRENQLSSIETMIHDIKSKISGVSNREVKLASKLGNIT